MNEQIVFFCKIIQNALQLGVKRDIEGRVDWQCMVEWARQHNLLPIFMEEAAKYSSYTNSFQYENEMQEALVIVAAQVKRTHAFLKLYTSFMEAGIHPIVVKGLVCRELYGGLADHRPSGDEDILIRISEYWSAKEVLIANGYLPQKETEIETQLEHVQEVSFFNPKEKLNIELHLNPMGRETTTRSQMSDCFKNVFDDYREVEIQGVKVRTMSHQDNLLFLILHAFRHFTSGGFGVRQMLDILLYQERYGAEIDVKRLYQKLKCFQTDIFWSDLIHIGNSYFGFNLSVLQIPNCPEELLEDMFLCGVFGNKTQAEVTAGRATMLATGNCLNYKVNNLVLMIRKALFPSKGYLLSHAPYLKEKPWLLPVEWVKRWGGFAKKIMNSDGNLAADSIKISQRRMKLLKKYDLL